MPDYCHIAKDKTTGERFLIPGCYSVANFWHLDMPDREIIKEFCICDRPAKKGNEKYCEIEKDEVIAQIQKLEYRIDKVESILRSYKEDLDALKGEVMLLNLEEEFTPDQPNQKLKYD